MVDNYIEEYNLSEAEPPYSFDVWLRLANSKEMVERCEALNHLPDDAPDDIVVEFVLDSIRNANSLVRVCAADAARLLRGYPKITEALRVLVQDEVDELVLAFAYESLGRIGDYQDIPIFVRGLESSVSARVRLGILSGFCLLIRGIFMLDIYLLLKENNSDLFRVAVNEFFNTIEDQSRLEEDMLGSIEKLSIGIIPEMRESLGILMECLKRNMASRN